MTESRMIIGVSVFLAVIGSIFVFLPHDLHELLTFGISLPHSAHLALGFIIVVMGLAGILYSIRKSTFVILDAVLRNFKEKEFLRKSKIPFIIISILLIGFFALADSTKDAKANPEFDKLKEAAKYCTNPTDTGPQCLDSFKEMKGMMGSDSNDLQRTAQEKIGIDGKYGEDDGFNATEYLSTWNYNNLPPRERSKFYKETKRADGSLLREYWIYAEDKEIEIAPGVFFPAWTYNGQVPAPTIRATEGDSIRIYFTNKGTKPHTMHFHGFHPSNMDGSMPEDFVYPGQNFTYEFDADPFGVHLFHCHSVPLKQHISKGLYGAYIVDPKNDTRAQADKELVMIMNAFDTTLDGENEVYAVNTKAFYYALNPIKVKKDELVRIYLINIVEFDPINSFHLHATFFDEYRTGTKQEPNAYTDIVTFSQAERSILDVRFKYPGMYMFHAHVSEFTELGWMGFFEVTE